MLPSSHAWIEWIVAAFLLSAEHFCGQFGNLEPVWSSQNRQFKPSTIPIVCTFNCPLGLLRLFPSSSECLSNYRFSEVYWQLIHESTSSHACAIAFGFLFRSIRSSYQCSHAVRRRSVFKLETQLDELGTLRRWIFNHLSLCTRNHDPRPSVSVRVDRTVLMCVYVLRDIASRGDSKSKFNGVASGRPSPKSVSIVVVSRYRQISFLRELSVLAISGGTIHFGCGDGSLQKCTRRRRIQTKNQSGGWCRMANDTEASRTRKSPILRIEKSRWYVCQSTWHFSILIDFQQTNPDPWYVSVQFRLYDRFLQVPFSDQILSSILVRTRRIIPCAVFRRCSAGGVLPLRHDKCHRPSASHEDSTGRTVRHLWICDVVRTRWRWIDPFSITIRSLYLGIPGQLSIKFASLTL